MDVLCGFHAQLQRIPISGSARQPITQGRMFEPLLHKAASFLAQPCQDVCTRNILSKCFACFGDKLESSFRFAAPSERWVAACTLVDPQIGISEVKAGGRYTELVGGSERAPSRCHRNIARLRFPSRSRDGRTEWFGFERFPAGYEEANFCHNLRHHRTPALGESRLGATPSTARKPAAPLRDW